MGIYIFLRQEGRSLYLYFVSTKSAALTGTLLECRHWCLQSYQTLEVLSSPAFPPVLSDSGFLIKVSHARHCLFQRTQMQYHPSIIISHLSQAPEYLNRYMAQNLRNNLGSAGSTLLHCTSWKILQVYWRDFNLSHWLFLREENSVFSAAPWTLLWAPSLRSLASIVMFQDSSYRRPHARIYAVLREMLRFYWNIPRCH